MGRYHDRKMVLGSSKSGRIHQRMQQRRMSRLYPVEGPIGAPGMRMRMGMGSIFLPITLVSLIGFGVLGYALITKPAIPIAQKPKKISMWKRWQKSSVLPVAAIATPALPIVSAPVTVPVVETAVVPAPIIHNRKVPLRERALSKITRRPVITNYHV